MACPDTTFLFLRPDEWTAIGSIAVTFVTGALAWIAYRSNETLRATERPYVSANVRLLPIVRDANNDVVIEAIAYLSNKGKTPAVFTMLRGYMTIESSVPHHPKTFPGSEAKLPDGLAIMGDTEFQLPKKITITMSDLQALENLEKTLFFVGTCEYKGVVDPATFHKTGFCWRMQKGYVPDWRFKFAGDSELNYMT